MKDGHPTSVIAQPRDSDPALLRPLTGRNREGETYERPPDVERQLREVLALPAADLLARADVLDHEDPHHLAEESLVYLVRHYHAGEDGEMVRELWTRLLKRCAKRINRHLANLERDLREQAFTDVINDVVTQILDLQNSRGDFFQVRFWMAIDGRAITIFKRYLKDLQRVAESFNLSEIVGEEGGGDDDDGSFRLSAVREGVFAQGLTPEQSAILQVALEGVPEPFRTAFILRHAEGWQVESKDPAEPTISGYFGKTPRTIRTWLDKAEEFLSIWKDGNES